MENYFFCHFQPTNRPQKSVRIPNDKISHLMFREYPNWLEKEEIEEIKT